MSYPDQPGTKTFLSTTRAAAAGMVSRAPTLRDQVLRLLGLGFSVTPDEAAEALQVSILAIRPRFSELARMKKIQPSGHYRENASGKKAIVWELKPQVAYDEVDQGKLFDMPATPRQTENPYA